MTPPAPRRAARPISPRVLWFGLFGAAVAWSVQELVGYAVVAHACYPDWRPRNIPTTAAMWPITVALSVLAFGVGVLAAVAAWRAWRRTDPHSLQVGEDRIRFMAFSGVLVSGMVLFAVLLTLIVIFLVPGC